MKAQITLIVDIENIENLRDLEIAARTLVGSAMNGLNKNRNPKLYNCSARTEETVDYGTMEKMLS